MEPVVLLGGYTRTAFGIFLLLVSVRGDCGLHG